MTASPQPASRVRLFDASSTGEMAAFRMLRASGKVDSAVDALPQLIEELFHVEFPFLSTDSPLNRLPSSVCHLGLPKTRICAERVWELNPFQRVETFHGLTAETIEAFLGNGGDRLDLLIEETDDIHMKIHARFAARARRIPVLMATDNGDNTLLDVERFDLEPRRHLFHGAVEENRLRRVPRHPSHAEKVALACLLVGSGITPRMQLSLQQVGTRLTAWPQLGTAAALSGVALAYAARRILTGQLMPSGRYTVDLDALLDAEYQTPRAVDERTRINTEYVTSVRSRPDDGGSPRSSCRWPRCPAAARWPPCASPRARPRGTSASTEPSGSAAPTGDPTLPWCRLRGCNPVRSQTPPPAPGPSSSPNRPQ
ncbi:hypothetical protein [Streptomyces lomondensis]|uniref:Uncharacterized protein n=1 Tax=Streptomyces lomondensis TaxID=68229 RepID=A0ABQ2X6T2_9ACTN|nr:hypothetical protein [Streptomyces lomondensis]MCF0078336.1 hypothetical protein [Streptomyces lomondensis]GGX02162.1 hypothetical protein GCM10010383_35450 [Streptomyces lomondensis]